MSKSPAPPLMPLFRSQLQGELLAHLLLAPAPTSITDLARHLGVPFATVHRECQRLIAAGLLSDERVGRTRIVTVNQRHLAFPPLRDLVMVTFGPRQVVEDEFANLAGVMEVLIYGSWAARYLGEAGPEPGDVDVLVVGQVDRDDVFDAADRAQRRLRRDVNSTVVTAERWRAAAEPFLQEVRRRPLVEVTSLDGPRRTSDVELSRP